MRVSRQWRDLLVRKRFGYGHETEKVQEMETWQYFALHVPNLVSIFLMAGKMILIGEWQYNSMFTVGPSQPMVFGKPAKLLCLTGYGALCQRAMLNSITSAEKYLIDSSGICLCSI